jgi:adenosylcobinamide-GDP ribazoletransferase
MNNFFHFDGLCDMLDSFLANKSKDMRLKILKDKNIGSFALGGAILFMLFKFAGIYLILLKEKFVPFFIVIPVYSRFIMVLLSFKSKYPRPSGTASLIVGKISPFVFLLSFLFFLIIILVFLFFSLVYNALINNLKAITIISIVMVIFYILFKFYSYKKIDGITGDVLGAGCEISELLIIFTLLFTDKWIIK